jgi:hypothetical protein
MRFSIQPEQRPEQKMRSISIEEVVHACENTMGTKPPLEHYFSPSKKESFIKKFLHYLNTGLLEAKHGNLDSEQYLAFVLSFQFTAPLLEIPAEKELGLFFRILQNTYEIEEVDLNLHFGTEEYEGALVGEKEALEAFRHEVEEYFGDSREVKDSVQKRVKKDAIQSIMDWQREQSIPVLAEAFGRSIVIPSFFSFKDNKLIQFYRTNTKGIMYRVSVPESLV